MRKERSMNKDLKPCPFCGAEVQPKPPGLIPITFFECKGCGAVVSFVGKEKPLPAVIGWNRRAEQ